MQHQSQQTSTTTFAVSLQRRLHQTRYYPAILLSVITLGGLLLRLYKISYHDYWHDEVITTFVVRLPATEIFQAIIVNDTHPPLYHILLHYWTVLFGDDLIVLRLFSVIISTICIPLTYLLGRTLVGNSVDAHAGTGVGLTAAGLIALSPFHIFHGQQARMYPLLSCLVLVATLLFLRAWRRGRWYDWLLLGLSIAAGFYTHVFFFFSVPALIVWAAFESYQQRRLNKWQWIGLLAAPVLGAIAFLPFLPRMIALTGNVTGGFWIQTATLFDWMYTLVSVSNYATVAHDPRFGTPFWYLVLTFLPGVAAVLLTLVYSVREARRHAHEREAWLLLHALIWVPIAIATLLSITIQPILLDRALIGIAAPLALLMAWMGVRFWKNILVKVIAIAFAGSLLATLVYIYPDTPEPNEMIQTANYLANEQQPGDAIFYTDWQSFDAWVLTHPERKDIHVVPGSTDPSIWVNRIAVMRWHSPQNVGPVEEFAPRYQRVWLVLTNYSELHYHRDVTLKWLDAHGRQIERRDFGPASVFLYELTSISPTTTS